MLRIVFWKVRCAIVTTAGRWASADRQRTVHYFAFGANLHPSVMRRRQIRVFAEEAMALQGYRLCFAQPGPWQGCGFATVVEEPGCAVWGKLYVIAASDARRLEYEELVPIFGRHRKLELEQAGRRFFLFQAVRPRLGLKPTARYLDYIVGGLEGYPGVPPEYVEALRGVETARPGAISDSSGYLVKDVLAYPRSLRPLARLYERLGAWTLSKL